MDITKARRVVELTKNDKKILVTLWEGDKISSCVEEVGARAQRCETCEGDAQLCQDYIEHLKSQGYQPTEVLVSEIGVEQSLPKFLEEKAIEPVEEAPIVEETPLPSEGQPSEE